MEATRQPVRRARAEAAPTPAELAAAAYLGRAALVQVVRTPAKVQVVRTPAKVQVVRTPAEVQVVRTLAEVQVVRTPAEVQVVRTPAEPARAEARLGLPVARATLIVQQPCRPAAIPTLART